jgi:hypothetical protein
MSGDKPINVKAAFDQTRLTQINPEHLLFTGEYRVSFILVRRVLIYAFYHAITVALSCIRTAGNEAAGTRRWVGNISGQVTKFDKECVHSSLISFDLADLRLNARTTQRS